MERELEGWRAGGMDVWQLSEVQRAGGQEVKLVNEISSSELLQSQQTDNSYSSSPLFFYSSNNSHTSIPPYLYTSIITAILTLFLTFPPCFAEDLPMSALVTPTNVDFKICTRNYIMPEEKLFYMAIASAGANNFEVNEIQSKTGYILFTAAGKQYLASVSKVDSKNSMLKITPVNNNYFFAPGIVLNFFRYIDLNGATPIVNL